MARSSEATQSQLPSGPDQEGWRHFGDGIAGKFVAARLQGFYPTAADYRDVQVDVNGVVQTSSGAGGGGAATIADGADVAQGTTTDLSSANTVIGLLKAIKAALAAALTVTGSLGRTWTLGSGTDSVAAVQGAAAAAGAPWAIRLSDGAAFYTGAKDSTLTDGTQRGAMKLLDTGGTNAAAISAAGRLSVDASGVAVPITDNAGSLTVDAPVATPVFSRLSDGAAALIGQKAMTASLPVVLASDQASVPVAATLAAETTKVIGTVAQGAAAAVAGAWPVKVTDGTNTQPTGDVVARAIFHKVTDGTTAVKVTVANAQPISTDGALLVNAIDTFAGTILTSASHGVATVNTDIVNYNGKGIRVWQDLTVLGASSVCQFSIQEKDPVSGKFITLLASAATGAGINSTGTAKLTVYPGLTAAANVTASDVVPVNIRIVSTVTVAASTFSIGYSLIP